MLSVLFQKKTGMVILFVLLLFVLSACTGAQEGSPDDLVIESTNSPSQAPSPDVSEKDTDSENILQEYYYGVVDAPIEDFELEDLKGNMVKLSDFKGKIVFLNFWATWCPPCREEMPHMQAFHEKYQDEDVVILAVNPNQVENQGVNNSERAEEKARNFVEDHGFTFPVLLDRDDSVWAVYQQRGIPANYIIDKEGMIIYMKPGAFLSLQEMEDFAKVLGLKAN